MLPSPLIITCLLLFGIISLSPVPPNGSRYRRLGRNRLGNGNLPKFRITPKNALSPSRPVHALLGGVAAKLSTGQGDLCSQWPSQSPFLCQYISSPIARI